jgi:histidinol phosphatase-like PHP family hydrolase
MSYPIDLHTHTNASYGRLKAVEFIGEATERCVAKIVITDYRTGISKSIFEKLGRWGSK